MAVNIQNIIDQITTKAAAADSSMGTQYLLSLSKAVLAMNNATGVIEYRAKSELPTVDSSILGNFAYIAARADLDSVYGDSYAGFYYAARIGSNDSGWDRIRTGADSDAEQGGGAAGTQAQGSISGYTSTGGNSSSISSGMDNVIQKFSFAIDTNATDVGDLTVSRNIPAGQSSSISGYTSGGLVPPSFSRTNVIDKFPFSTDGNATDVGNLTLARIGPVGQISDVSGYSSSGGTGSYNTIDKFPFAIDANATDVGDLTAGRYNASGQSSTVSGYTTGGVSSPNDNIIDKFPFSTDANATDVGDLNVRKSGSAGQSSDVSGYATGGFVPTTSYQNQISKFSFATDGNATDVGDLTSGFYRSAGQSSTISGYQSGGRTAPAGASSPGGATNVIQKFPFSTDENATDVADLIGNRAFCAGHQV